MPNAMGWLRLALAMIVFQSHARQPGLHYAWANVAVLVFYALSGYGCTAAMQGHYKGHPLKFVVSRYVRLWPGFLAVFALSSVAWVVVEDLPIIRVPTGLGWWASLFMVHPANPMVPVAWVIPFMLAGYAVIGLGISATPQRMAAWLGVSFVWSQHQALVLDWGGYCNSWAAWSLSTAIGAAFFWLPANLPKDTSWATEIAFPLFLCHQLILRTFQAWGWDLGWPLFFTALGPTLALSWLLVVAVERPVQTFRQQLWTNHGN